MRSAILLGRSSPRRTGAHRSADGSHPRCGPQGGTVTVNGHLLERARSRRLVYQSRFTGHTCMAVFDRAVGTLAVRDVTGLVQHPKFADVLIDYETTLRSTERQVSRGRNGGGA